MFRSMDIEEMVDTLDKMASKEGTELGDLWRCLNYLFHYKDYLLNDYLITELETEIEHQYEHYLTIEMELE